MSAFGPSIIGVVVVPPLGAAGAETFSITYYVKWHSVTPLS